MASASYAKNKKHIYKYRETHPEKCREVCRRHKAKAYLWKRAQRIYLGILRDM